MIGRSEKEPTPVFRYDFETVDASEATPERLNELGERGFAIAAVVDGRLVLQRASQKRGEALKTVGV